VVLQSRMVPRRILLLTTTASWGGAEALVRSQARRFSAGGWEVAVGALSEGDGTLFRELKGEPAVQSFALGLTKTGWYRIAELQLKLGELRPDIIIAHLFHPSVAARFFGRLFRGIPVISVFHSTRQERWRTAIDRLTLPLTAKYVVVSEDGAKFAKEALSVDDCRLVVIANGVDAKSFQSPARSREQVRHELGMNGQATVVGCVARFHPQKDHRTLVQAFKRAHMANARQELKLLLVGTGAEMTAIRQLVEKLGLREHVTFTGFRRDLPELYAAMDVYAQTSRHEGLPTSILEAMSAGLPIAATGAPGITSVLRDGENALLAPVGEVKAVADRITRLVQEPELAGRLSATAKRQAETEYSLETCMDAYYNLALSVLGLDQ